MKHPAPLRAPARRLLALVLAAALLVPAAFASAGQAQITTTQTIADGLTYQNTVTDHPDAGRVESFSLELSPDSGIFPILIQPTGTIYGSGTIHQAVRQAQAMGYYVLGGVNSDFFTLSTGVPNGVCIEDGIYRSSPDGNHVIASVDGALRLSQSPQVAMTLTNQRTGQAAAVDHFNKWRDYDGGLYLFDSSFSSTTHTDGRGGWVVVMEPVQSSQDIPLTVNSTLTLEVVDVTDTSESVPIGENQYIFTADHASSTAEFFAGYEVGDRITLTTSCADPNLSRAQWAGGCGDILVQDGSITDNSDWNYPTGRAPRTSVGVKADGTLVLYAADGRQSGYSGGLTEMDLAEEMQRRGCVWAVNLDGGGSTTFALRQPGQSGVTVANSPSGGALRACASFLLLVADPSVSDGVPSRLALEEDGAVVLASSSLTLGSVTALDGGADTVDFRVADAAFTSQAGLGSFDGGVYTAGSTPGTDSISITSPSLGVSGSAQIHVVTSLTGLTVTKTGSSAALTSLQAQSGDVICLSASGTYWSRTALRPGAGGVTWSVTGEAGTITRDGVFTSSGGTGAIVVSAGGLTRTIPVNESKYVHTDVQPGHWAYDAVEYCYEQGITNGVSSTEFGKSLSIRRSDFVVMLYNSQGKPQVSGSSGFADVADGVYYDDAVTWAAENGLVQGVSSQRFAPADPITREQAATILHRAMSLLGISAPQPDLSVLEQFSDREDISGYARAPMAALVSMGILQGTGSGLNPKGSLTRAEMAVLLHRLLAGEEDGGADLPQLGPDAALTLDQDAGALAGGQSLSLTAALTGGTGTIAWTSSNPAVAAVSQDGVVTCVYTGTGSAHVTITASCGGLSASAVLTCTAPQQVGRVTADPSLNVRSGPGTGYSLVGSLSHGDQVALTGAEEGGWLQVAYSSAGAPVTGWVSGSYLQLV